MKNIEHTSHYFWKVFIPSCIALIILLSNKWKNGHLKIVSITNDVTSTIGIPYLCKDLIFAYVPENGIVIVAGAVAGLSHRIIDFMINIFDLNTALQTIIDAFLETLKNWINKK